MPGGYDPISDYGAVGNLRTAALISRSGSVDWCCLPRLSSPSVFGALLDHRKGGHWRIGPARGRPLGQRYVEDTNVLETTFEAEGGRLVVTDFMPLRGDITGHADASEGLPELRRIVRGEGGGTIEVDLEWAPRFDYARAVTRLDPARRGFVAAGHADRLALGGLPEGAETRVVDGHGPSLRARFRVEGNRPVALVATWGTEEPDDDLDRALTLERDTSETWRNWLRREKVAGRGWADPWADLVMRSELALKLLMHAKTGALAAAATTSLPETIGGVRNWDYRYAWIRDASLLAQALNAVGHTEEIVAFTEWAEEVSRGHRADGEPIRVLYGLGGETELPEEELGHLEGYRGSRPVRVGNAGADQKQHDIFSDLLCSAHEMFRGDEARALSRSGLAPFLCSVADTAAKRWREPDDGIWEMRTGPHHFVYSKVKVWQALTRAVFFAEKYGLPGDVGAWKRARREIREEVLRRGYDRDLGSFILAYDIPELDAANLQIPMLEFVLPDDPRALSTLDRTIERLADDDLVYRYKADDGLPGEEGAFVLCSYWMVDALVLAGRGDRAHAHFEKLAGRVNHLGLYSEQIDPRSGLFLGNFPQAFSHLGLINSVLYLAYAEGRELPNGPLIGTPDHRRELGLTEAELRA